MIQAADRFHVDVGASRPGIPMVEADIDHMSVNKVILLTVPAMAISSTTPENGCGRTCQRLRWI